jgi:hypothetical protein
MANILYTSCRASTTYNCPARVSVKTQILCRSQQRYGIYIYLYGGEETLLQLPSQWTSSCCAIASQFDHRAAQDSSTGTLALLLTHTCLQHPRRLSSIGSVTVQSYYNSLAFHSKFVLLGPIYAKWSLLRSSYVFNLLITDNQKQPWRTHLFVSKIEPVGFGLRLSHPRSMNQHEIHPLSSK